MTLGCYVSKGDRTNNVNTAVRLLIRLITLARRATLATLPKRAPTKGRISGVKGGDNVIGANAWQFGLGVIPSLTYGKTPAPATTSPRLRDRTRGVLVPRTGCVRS